MLLMNDSKQPAARGGGLGHDPTKLNIKGRLKNNFQTASLYQKLPALSKIEVPATFYNNWKKTRSLFILHIVQVHGKTNYPKD